MEVGAGELGAVATLVIGCLEATDVQKKQELEQELEKWRERPDAWQIAVKLLQHAVSLPANQQQSGQYCYWFALSVFEKLTGRQKESRTMTRETLLDFLVTHQKKLSPFVLNKISKILVEIAQHQWPEEDLNFIDRVISLVNHSETKTMMSGLVILRITAEQFGSKQGSTNTDRHRQLTSLMSQKIPQILNAVSSLLRKCIPSIPSERDGEIERVACYALEVFIHFYAWAPLETCFHAQANELLFEVVNLGGECGILATACLLEVVNRNYTPQPLQEVYYQMFIGLCCLLQRLTSLSHSDFDDLEDDYVSRLVHLLSALVSRHLSRFHSRPDFPINDFLSVLYRFTFGLSSPETFLSVLGVWSILLQSMVGHSREGEYSSGIPPEKYEEGMAAFSQELLKRMQYTTNGEILFDLDDESVVEGKSTERDLFFRGCLDVMEMVIELYPEMILSLLLPRFNAHGCTVCEAQFSGNLSEKDETRLISAICDLNTYVSMFGMLSQYFLIKFLETREDTLKILSMLLELTHQLYGKRVLQNQWRGKKDLIRLFTALPLCLRSYISWLRLLGGNDPQNVSSKLTTGFCGCLPLILTTSQDIPEVCVPAIGLIRSVASIARPVSLPGEKSLSEIRGYFRDKFAQIPLEITLPLFDCMAVVLLFPVPQHQWDVRKKELFDFLMPIMKFILERKDWNPNDGDTIGALKCCYAILTKITSSIDTESSLSKNALFEVAIKEVLPAAAHHFSVSVTSPDVCKTVLKFFKQIFKSLKQQIGLETARDTISLFLQVFEKLNIEQMIINSRAHQKMLSTFIKILTSIIQDESPTMKKVHPDVLHLVLNSITPAVGKHIDSASPLLSPLSLFYYDLLLCQWRMLVNDDSPSPQMGVVLETFLPILSSSDIASTKKGCELLLKLNEKRRLFSQKFFLSGFREQYLRVVMTILLKMTHDLLREDLVALLFAIAAPNWSSFYTQFLPRFVNENCQGRDTTSLSFPKEQNLNSFRLNLDVFINDWKRIHE